MAKCGVLKGMTSEANNELLRAWAFRATNVRSARNMIPHMHLYKLTNSTGYVSLPKSEREERIISNADLYNWELDDNSMKELDNLDKGRSGAITWNPVHVD